MRKILSWLCASLLMLTGIVHNVEASDPVPLKTAWLVEHEAFVAWYAQKQRWDIEEGFRLEMQHYDSGKALMANMDTEHWQIAACGAIPALTANMAAQVEIIAIGNDESLATGVYARPNSPMLERTGYNALYPEMAGTASSVRGKTILVTKRSSTHYTVAKWLKALHLTEKDVTLKDLPPAEALNAFLNGEGDAVALWAPHSLEAEHKGLVPVTLSSQCDAKQPTLVLANKSFAQKNPALVTSFLKMYFRGITALHNTPRERLVEEYRAFYKEWTGMDLPPASAAWELAKHPVYEPEEQLALFNAPKKGLHAWLTELTTFTGGQNRLGDMQDMYLKKIVQK